MMIRGRFGLGMTRPVLGFFQSCETATDQSPFLPSVDLTASRERSNGELKQVISSPFRTDFQKTLRTNDVRFCRISCVSAGKCSISGRVGGSSLYLCSTFDCALVTSSR